MNHADLSDEVLAKKLRTDPQFLGDIIERYEGKLSNYIRRKSSASTEDIQDILQNVFIKVYKNIFDFDTALPFSSWIYRITRNEMIDWYRREKRTPHLSLEGSEALLQSIASENDITAEVSSGEFRQALEGVVTELPEKYRDIVVLRFFEEKSYDEIADILALPPGTVAVRINRVKKTLQQKLHSYATAT